jgi:hemerythrin
MWVPLKSGDASSQLNDDANLNEHHHLAQLLDRFRATVTQSASVSEQRFALHAVAAYFRGHCLGEEALMEHGHFPCAQAHKAEHLLLYDAISLVDNKIFDGADRDTVLNALELFRRSILFHTREADQEILDWHHNCLRELQNGISPCTDLMRNVDSK